MIRIFNFWNCLDIFKKWVSCDTCGRVDTKNIFILCIFESECCV